MTNNCNIIECCNDTHQGAPRIGKQMSACASDLNDSSHVTREVWSVRSYFVRSLNSAWSTTLERSLAPVGGSVKPLQFYCKCLPIS